MCYNIHVPIQFSASQVQRVTQACFREIPNPLYTMFVEKNDTSCLTPHLYVLIDVRCEHDGSSSLLLRQSSDVCALPNWLPTGELLLVEVLERADRALCDVSEILFKVPACGCCGVLSSVPTFISKWVFSEIYTPSQQSKVNLCILYTK